jgi:hypothetical protein
MPHSLESAPFATWESGEFLEPGGVDGVIQAVPIMMFAFSCQVGV